MKYDDASWHYGGDFPEELPDEAGATHTGMFVSWGLLKGLGGQLHTEEFPEDLEKLLRRETTPGQFFIDACDQKFTDEDLNDEGNGFTQAYFDFTKGFYLSDYETTLSSNSPTLYHVADSWENFDILATVIDRRFGEWKSGSLKTNENNSVTGEITDLKPWWKFW